MDLNALKKISISKTDTENVMDSSDIGATDIAIIGINAQIGNAKNAEEFWESICKGCDMIRDFPAQRWHDANRLSQLQFNKQLAEEPSQCAYLDRIDLFDAGLFNISSTEAELMDPVQRIFLESAWSALEDSGYGGSQLNGSKTGVYIGYNGAGNSYNPMIHESDPYTFGIAMSGNISAIIASRISYLLNLKGPAVNIDTACSSTLVAVHFACQQIRDGEVSMALVGGIRLMISACQTTDKKMGIESSTGRTKTFDDSADGTGGGEGVISIVLKSLQQAVRDKDNIYAVIKGSSINQDGASVGITAPNAASQEEVIRAAWKDAEVNPETISYIEAHGTGTNLGDPVEISGIERAFSHFTDKKQFCAIGSVKSNVGHLDCAAGLAGLLKAVLMLKHKQIPPTIHFNAPNRKIDFMSSPVYINDKLIEWEYKEGPRRCGISSFGISGTNCHVILEEAPKLHKAKTENPASINVLTASAKNRETVQKIIQQYQAYLKQSLQCSFDDFCYTANIGRGHYNCRFAVIVDSGDEFFDKTFDLNLPTDGTCFYGEHKVVDVEGNLMPGYISPTRKKELTNKAVLIMEQAAGVHDIDEYKHLLNKIIQLYVQGADVPWNQLYKKETRNRVSIPTYPYNHKRYWINIPEKDTLKIQASKTVKLHPLIDECILDTYQMQVYSTKMSIDTCWELKYHKINGKNVLPGTAFIEMAQFVSSCFLKSNLFEIQELVFMIPLVCRENEVRTVHTIARMEDSILYVACYSKNDQDDEWICHVELKVQKDCKQVQFVLNVNEIISRCEEADKMKKANKLSIVEIDGEQWDSLRRIYTNDDEILLDLKLNEGFEEQKKGYFLYPSLLDPSINGGNFILQDVHLPFSCTRARFYEEIPESFYSYIRRKSQGNESNEFATFDIVLCTKDGRTIGEVEDYIIKRVHHPEFFMINQKMQMNMFYAINWTEYEKIRTEELKPDIGDDIILVLCRPGQKNNPFMGQLEKRLGNSVVAVELGGNDFDGLLCNIRKDRIKHIIQLASFTNTPFLSVQELEYETRLILKSTFLFVKALLNNGVSQDIQLTLLTLNATSVTGNETNISPLNQALIGMGFCISEEYSNIKTRAIDCDENTDSVTILNELMNDEPMYAVAYRHGKRYVEQIDALQYSEQIHQEKLELKDKGIYIITGGLGGIALSLCRYLYSINQSITVILLNRTYSRADFEELTGSDDVLLQKKIDLVNKLWAEGKEVDIIKADISDYDLMDDVFQKIRKRYGAINGVIHTAGVAGDGFILSKEWEIFEDVLKPKIYGTWVLHHLTLEDNLSFFVMCSSFASVFGAPGQSDYTAANAYLDSFTYYRRSLGQPSLTINWTGWSESGMAVANNVDESKLYVHFVNDAEGANAFAYVLKTKLPRVLVGEINYPVFTSDTDKFSRKLMMSGKMMEKKLAVSKPTADSRNINDIIITGKSMDKLTEVEKHVIYAWAQALGVNEIDVHDKFFESGGNSLLASYLHKELNKVYPGAMAITDVFVYSTVAEIASRIDSKINGNTKKQVIELENEEQDIKKLVEQFVRGDIDLDQIEELLGD